MSVLFSILAATFAISVISLVGVFSLSMRKELLKSLVFYLVALSAGALLGSAFLHLIPEALRENAASSVFPIVIAGFFVFFFIEKILHWRHCHDDKCDVHSFAYMSLAGDAVHNFIDGLIIAATFIANPALGITSTIAIALHEIPQEIGDFAVLIHGGVSRTKALFYNFITALTAVAGGIAGYFASEYFSGAVPFLLPFAAGSFLYISASDLVPEIRKEVSLKKSAFIFIAFLAGIMIMVLSVE
ncbi:ZIP family metal transporter [Candidatus Micrarchaeota archaeon]|nr:ZIP family metal transporter [Candidatus Micrarchaeota archaeon]